MKYRIKENFLHFLWKYNLFENKALKTVCGKSIEILHAGEHNSNSGPDFLHARIRIDGTLWVGNVEIHLFASEWIKHGHQLDPAYETVILHVVGSFDVEISDHRNRIIPALILKYPEKMERKYYQLMENSSWIPCEFKLHAVPVVFLLEWYTRLTADRLERKTSKVKELLDRYHNNWEEVLYIMLASGFGLPVNTLPFEMLAASVPLRLVNAWKHDLFRLEAMFFGQAGLLDSRIPEDHYLVLLQKEYTGIKGRFESAPIPGHLWKFLRLRPASFPTLRISQFAGLLNNQLPLLPVVREYPSLKELQKIFRLRAGDYWNTHYTFGRESPPSVKHMGTQAISGLLINHLIPFLFIYGKNHQDQSITDRSLEYLEDLRREDNEIIKKWGKFGVKANNAFESQALLQLYNEYCKQRRCLDCQIGMMIIRNEES